MTTFQNTLIEAVVKTAEQWEDEAYAPRLDAIRKTLETPGNRFTQEAITFAVNQQIHELTGENLRSWLDGRVAAEPLNIAILNAGNVPFIELQDFLAVLLTGHRYSGSLSSRSPFLLPAFAGDLVREMPDLVVEFLSFPDILKNAGAVIATGSGETAEIVGQECDAHGIVPAARLIRGTMYTVAVIDGKENEEERSGLAEDVLLHDGAGCRNVAMIWAPEDLNPDPYLDVMAQFREVIAPHPEVNGSLQMARALYAATDQPHAYGDGFLISKGPPEFQQPAHIRWVEYRAMEDVHEWLTSEEKNLQGIVASGRVAGRISTALPVWLPGEAQRPRLDWCPDRRDTVAFLAGLKEGGR